VRRWTFTTTRSPVRRVAAWTWAIDAEAMGIRSKDWKTSARGRPRSSSTVLRTSEKARGARGRAAAELVDQLVGEDPLSRGDDLASLM